MKINFKSGPSPNHFESLRPGDVFILAEQASDPPEKWEVYIKVFNPEHKSVNAVCLRSGEAVYAPCKTLVIKAEVELTVIF